MRSCLYGGYSILIVNAHPSYLSTKIIGFAQEHKIMCLSLPAHSTHLLQPLDLWIFGHSKKMYKTLLVDKIRFTMYNIDKADFTFLIHKARQQANTTRNIQSPLQATGLIPYNLSTLFNKI